MHLHFIHPSLQVTIQSFRLVNGRGCNVYKLESILKIDLCIYIYILQWQYDVHVMIYIYIHREVQQSNKVNDILYQFTLHQFVVSIACRTKISSSTTQTNDVTWEAAGLSSMSDCL